jgi:hypothetical protein
VAETSGTRHRIWRQINRLLILIAVAALLWGVLQSEWRIVLIQARYL